MKEFSSFWRNLKRWNIWMLLFLFRYFLNVSFFSWMRDLVGISNCGESLSSQTIASWGIKLLSIFIMVLLKTETFSLTIVLRKAPSILKSVISRLIGSVFSCSLAFFALKLPMTTVKKGIFCVKVFTFISRISINAWKPSWFWLGLLYRVIKLHKLIYFRNLYILINNWRW